MTRRTPAILLILALSCLSALAQEAPIRVLLVLAQQHPDQPDYGPLRGRLEARGVQVSVAAPALALCYSHSGEAVMPDLTVAEVSEADFDAIVIVGGWGAASLQPDFPGQWLQAGHSGDSAVQLAATILSELTGRWQDIEGAPLEAGFAEEVFLWGHLGHWSTGRGQGSLQLRLE